MHVGDRAAQQALLDREPHRQPLDRQQRLAGAGDRIHVPRVLAHDPHRRGVGLAGHLAQSRHGGEEGARVGLSGVGEDLVHCPRLDQAPAVHDDDAVGDLRDHGHVVGDEQDRGAGLPL